MPYYHVFINYVGKLGKKHSFFSYDRSHKTVKETIATPFQKNKAFMFGGRVLHVSDIILIYIYMSEKPVKELVLPNGKSPLDETNNFYILRCFNRSWVKGIRGCTRKFIASPPQEKKEVKTLIGLMECASFMGLDDNWSSATCALQLQEVAVTLVAKRKKIKLDKANVERLLNKKVEDLSFNDRYKAFSRQVKASFDVEMPILTTHLRKMRTKVLHEGYNPKPEETDSIVGFTIGLLKKLEDIS